MVNAENLVSEQEGFIGNGGRVAEKQQNILLGNATALIGQAEQTSTELEVRAELFHTALSGFMESDEVILSLSAKVREVEADLNTVGAEEEKSISGFEKGVGDLKQRVKCLRSKADSASMKFQNDRKRNSPKVDTYFFLRDLGMARIAGILYPVEGRQRSLTFALAELNDLEKQKVLQQTKYHEEKNELEEKKTDLILQERDRKENWVMEEKERVIMYAIENPLKAKDIFCHYCEKMDSSSLMLQDLISEYSRLTGKKPDCFLDSTLSPREDITEKHRRLRKNHCKKHHSDGKTEDNGGVSENRGVAVKEDEVQKKPCVFGTMVTVIDPRGNRLKKVIEMDDNDVREYVFKSLGNLSQNNENIADIFLMLGKLKENPRDPKCTRKLAARAKLVTDYKSVDLRRFSPADLAGLNLKNPKLKEWRIVYGVLEKGDNLVIILESISDHKEFDRNFAYHK